MARSRTRNLLITSPTVRRPNHYTTKPLVRLFIVVNWYCVLYNCSHNNKILLLLFAMKCCDESDWNVHQLECVRNSESNDIFDQNRICFVRLSVIVAPVCMNEYLYLLMVNYSCWYWWSWWLCLTGEQRLIFVLIIIIMIHTVSTLLLVTGFAWSSYSGSKVDRLT